MKFIEETSCWSCIQAKSDGGHAYRYDNDVSIGLECTHKESKFQCFHVTMHKAFSNVLQNVCLMLM